MITLLNLRPYTDAIVAPSPNHGVRNATAIEGIVLHATEDGGNEARTLSWMRSPRSRVSCHLVVSRTGRVTRLVGDQQRAWHAGASSWRGQTDVNSITLGIEIANRNDGEPYTPEQYARVASIVAHYCRQGLSLADVVSHADISPGRKSDPVGWDWNRFRAMVQHQLAPAPVHQVWVPQVVASKRPVTKPKTILRSRTLWLNTLTVMIALSAIVIETLDLALWVGLTVPEEVTMWVLFGVGVVNIVLRFRTTGPVCTTSTRAFST